MTTIALFGAAGKIGSRIAALLKDDAAYQTLFVESGAAEQRLRDAGLTPSNKEEAIKQADVVILAVPDLFIGKIAGEIVPQLKPGALVIGLDPAAPHSHKLPARSDISYFITHPCHPPIYYEGDTDLQARNDHFGGIAKQNIVCALMQGPEEHYILGETLARKMFAPVMNAHRITVEQMAILEPALVETITIPLIMVIREAMDEAVKRGVPPAAARDFLLGHINIDIAILFGYLNAQFSDGAKMAAQRGMEQIIKPDWKRIFEPENIMHEVRIITEGVEAATRVAR